MRLADKIWKFFDRWLPYIWGFLFVLAITGGLCGLLIIVVKWILRLLGVM